MRLIDLVGERFGRLVVLSLAPTRNKETYWNCLCDCGNDAIVRGKHLRYKSTTSCGCLISEMLRDGSVRRYHGNAGIGKVTPEYRTWSHIKSRCFNPNVKDFKNYGGRGISMFEGWIDNFPAFLEYMGTLPLDSHTVERIDNDKGYEPGNVKWDSRLVQGRNRRHIRMTLENAMAIRKMVTDGASRKSMETEFGVSKSVVANIMRNRTWL